MIHKKHKTRAASLLLSGVLPILLLCIGAKAPEGRERAPGYDFRQADALIEAGIARKELPGAVLVVGHGGRVVYRRAYGDRAVVPDVEPMTVDTVFDMASLTKPLVTALAAAQLIEQHRLELDRPVAAYWPAFGANGKQAVTVRELLTHYSGLPPDLDLSPAWTGKLEGFRRAAEIGLATTPGTVFRYSDINFIALQAVIERITGEPLESYAQERIFKPLHLQHSRFLPPPSWKGRIAPTEYDTNGGPQSYGTMLRGVVHDPTARRMGGVAGHAGLFMTAGDLAVYAQALLNRRSGRSSRFPLDRATLLRMTTPEQPAGGKDLRGLGWDIDSPYSGNRGAVFPIGSFGHTGFTGTSIWLDPASDTYVILLANAVHPHAGHNITHLRGEVATAVAKALGASAAAVPAR